MAAVSPRHSSFLSLAPRFGGLHGAPRRRARRSRRRSTASSGSVAEPAREPPRDALVGLGRPGAAAGAARARAGLPARDRRPRRASASAGGARARAPARRRALSEAALGRAARDRRRRGVSATDTPSASCTPPARAIPTSCACARASRRARPTRSSTPPSTSSCAALLELCARGSLAVVPFGGGTSVVGGVAPLRGEHSGVIALDMAPHGGRARARPRSRRPSRVQAGMRAPALERRLAARGLTLGHFPQSFEYVSLGGCAATRSAGQASTGYGAIEKMVLGLRLAAPAGEIELPRAARERRRARPAPAAGRLGGHARGDQRARAARAPGAARAHLRGRLLRGLRRRRGGAARARAGARAPDVARLSDEPETRMSLALAGTRRREGAPRARLPAAARLRRRAAWRSSASRAPREEVARRRARALELVRARRRPRRSGARPARRGCRGASRRPTCATSCSRTA